MHALTAGQPHQEVGSESDSPGSAEKVFQGSPSFSISHRFREISAPSASIQFSGSAHKGDAIRDGLWPAESCVVAAQRRSPAAPRYGNDPILVTTFGASIFAVGNGHARVGKVRPRLPVPMDRAGKRQVRRAIQGRAGVDPLGEDETSSQLESYLSGLSVPDDEISKYIARLRPKNIPEIPRSARELHIEEVEEVFEEPPCKIQKQQ